MKLFKRILLVFSVLVLLSAISAHFYFERKFSPDENFLTVKNESGKVSIRWDNEDKTAMLLPIHFDSDTATYYLQFDTGSPYTLLYRKSITGIGSIALNKNTAKGRFRIGSCEVSSDYFKVIDFGREVQDKAVNIIGTIGTDILENRKTILDFKDNYVMINLTLEPENLRNKTFGFSFKKRKVIIQADLENKEEKFLYDSGSSAYELLTNKDIWEKLRLKDSEITEEKGQSWNNVLSTYTANTNKSITFHNTQIPLQHVTYVEGYSKTQYYMMKFSGMSGMLGNKIFANKKLYIDAKNMKMSIN